MEEISMRETQLPLNVRHFAKILRNVKFKNPLQQNLPAWKSRIEQMVL